MPALDDWLARQFAQGRVEATIDSLTAAQDDRGVEQQIIVQAWQIILKDNDHQ